MIAWGVVRQADEGVTAGLNQSTVRSARVQQLSGWKAADSSAAQVDETIAVVEADKTTEVEFPRNDGGFDEGYLGDHN